MTVCTIPNLQYAGGGLEQRTTAGDRDPGDIVLRGDRPKTGHSEEGEEDA